MKLSEYNAIELYGPAVETMLKVSSILVAGSVLLTVVLAWRLLRNFQAGDKNLTQAILLSVLAVVLATIISNKTLSTQYVQWLWRRCSRSRPVPGYDVPAVYWPSG